MPRLLARQGVLRILPVHRVVPACQPTNGKRGRLGPIKGLGPNGEPDLAVLT
jgi:hypothetical protein